MYNGLPFVGFTLGALWGASVGFVCGLGAVGFGGLITSGVGATCDDIVLQVVRLIDRMLAGDSMVLGSQRGMVAVALQVAGALL